MSPGHVAEGDALVEGVASAGNDLLNDFPSGAQLYARVMTRSRAHELAYKKLTSLIHDKPGEPAAHPELESSLRQIGTAVATYFTPEEKRALAASAKVRNRVCPKDTR